MTMLNNLTPLLKNRDMIGYVAARNYRILTESLTEFNDFKEELIRKYGTPDKDEEGNELSSISVNPQSKEFEQFIDELEPFANIEHEVDLMFLKYDKVIGVLSGEEILSVEWMLVD